MNEFMIDIGPYFLGSLVIAFVLAIVSAWWNRSVLSKAAAFAALATMVYLVFMAVTATNNKIDYIVNNLLSRPKVVTFEELQAMLPEGHTGHLVLYGETKSNAGVYLLLRSPGVSEPRYYLLLADEKTQEEFKRAKREAKDKQTQLLLGGRVVRKGVLDANDGRYGEEGAANEREWGEGGGYIMEGENVFHPAPIARGPEKPQLRPQDEPVILRTPSGANPGP
ncbi:MAG: hypothetical protein HY455_00090 [Parcubacteria group bacterium]|nr:hypothetical protein [Parcubacteria group bacterium]